MEEKVKWEYLITECDGMTIDEEINHMSYLGGLGWELVSTNESKKYFKRPLIETKTGSPIFEYAAWKASGKDGHEQGGYGDINYETVEGGYVFYEHGKTVRPIDLLKKLVVRQ